MEGDAATAATATAQSSTATAAAAGDNERMRMVQIPTQTILSSSSSSGSRAEVGSATAAAAEPPALPSNNNDSMINADNNTAVIRLDASEEQLFEILRQTAAEYNDANNANDANSSQPKLEIRVAGGWVRDKILQQHTHDVDVACNVVNGVQMAELVRNHLLRTTCAGGTAAATRRVSQVHRIAANPAQSKHLETATMRVAGMDVDFVHLRGSETYEAHSRIPSTQLGTPSEDAHRRDFTVNALFYNLHSGAVEDWTGRGWRDLQAGLLATPLDAHTTLMDDPLRVLRAIRFAVRYRFQIAAPLREAALNADVHRALHTKVSRERVGKELEGMLAGKGARPVPALACVADLQLAGSVFALPVAGGVHCARIAGTVQGEPYQVDAADDRDPGIRHLRARGWEEARELLELVPPVLESHDAMLQQPQPQPQPQPDDPSLSSKAAATAATMTTVDCRILPLAVFVSPFRHLQCWEQAKATTPANSSSNNSSSGRGPSTAQPKQFSVVMYMFKEGVKFKLKDCIAVTTLMQVVDRLGDLLRRTAATDSTDNNNNSAAAVTRLEVGLLLREAKELWVTALLFATVLQVRTQQQQQQQESTSTTAAAVTDWIQVSHAFYQKVVSDWKLDHCWRQRPLLDGRAVIAALHLPRGPQVGVYLEEQVRWMLSHPDGTVDECRAHLVAVKHKQHARSESPDVEMRGVSDGIAPSSPLLQSRKETAQAAAQHFSKKMHVERMDTS